MHAKNSLRSKGSSHKFQFNFTRGEGFRPRAAWNRRYVVGSRASGGRLWRKPPRPVPYGRNRCPEYQLPRFRRHRADVHG
jgi:hypothetical protein